MGRLGNLVTREDPHENPLYRVGNKTTILHILYALFR